MQIKSIANFPFFPSLDGFFQTVLAEMSCTSVRSIDFYKCETVKLTTIIIIDNWDMCKFNT